MKNWKILVCLLSIVFFVLTATACQQSSATGVEQLRGLIHQMDNGGGLYLTSGGKNYQIEGQQDLTAVIGKLVTAEGTVTQKDGKYTIAVTSVKE